MYTGDVIKNRSKIGKRFTLFLGGVKREALLAQVTEKENMASVGRLLGVKFAGFLIEYILDEREDTKIISLLMYPHNEKTYNCTCMVDREKMPMHILKGDSDNALEQLTFSCPCNQTFRLYFKK